MASMYAVYHGPDGLRAIAARVAGLAADLAGPRCAPAGWTWSTRRSSTPCSPGCRAGPTPSSPPRGERGDPPAPGRRRPRRGRLRRDDDPGPTSPAVWPRSAWRRRSASTVAARRTPCRGRPRTRTPGVRRALPAALRRTIGVPDPPGVHRAPHRDRDAALPAPARGRRLRARPGDDPARLVHDEAQRHHRDGAGHLAGVRRAAPVRAGRAGRRHPGADRRPRGAGWPRSPATTR